MKLALSLNAINLIVTGAMSAGVVGITIATAMNDNGSEPESSEVMNEVEAANELEAEKATGEKTTEQEKQALTEAEEIVEEKPAKNEQSTQPTPQPQPQGQVTASGSATIGSHVSGGIHDSDSPNFVSYKYNHIGDFENAYLGYCAKDVPDGMWSEDLQPSVALGIKSRVGGQDYQTIKGQVTVLFNTYVWEGGRMSSGLGSRYQFIWVEFLGVETGYNDLTYSGAHFVLDWPTRTISYTEPYPERPISTEARAKIKAIAEEGTAYLRWMDSAYKAKCGNYTSLY